MLLASGCFEGNPEMMTRYIGHRARHIRPVALGGYYDRGEGIRMGLDAGAAPAGEFGSYHAGPVDRRSKLAEDVVLIYPYGIFVNQSAFFLVSPQIPDLLMARVPMCRRWGRALSSPVRS